MCYTGNYCGPQRLDGIRYSSSQKNTVIPTPQYPRNSFMATFNLSSFPPFGFPNVICDQYGIIVLNLQFTLRGGRATCNVIHGSLQIGHFQRTPRFFFVRISQDTLGIKDKNSSLYKSLSDQISLQILFL